MASRALFIFTLPSSRVPEPVGWVKGTIVYTTLAGCGIEKITEVHGRTLGGQLAKASTRRVPKSKMESGKWIVITQEGPENYKVYRHQSGDAARAQAKRLWCCWVLFEQLEPGDLSEKACGGVGPTFLIHPAIRTYATATFRALVKDSDARRGAAAAAEARAAATAKRAPAPKPKATTSGSDGKPDVSNPAVWD